ncbi:MAG: type II toxin-antitoxin system prevent-host-death family antitoxin [Brevundimonas sp.]|uniref:type II toxin-antitoxin system Phd/YefM family antitoxin n=1 Tax=Brevundimonas sp. TaxID=1871086 RepID=UPI0027342B50|nr:type II toxin-antitoxin system prevent-host-death family antitoxin [Brevundimonas sp.]MDP3404348.1 type II toxin-antitoxin system prevent-host-death family antitoxin [Brevundimonas sp.]
METVNTHEAKTHLSRLIQKAVDGEPFIIARAGKPLVKVTAIEAAPARKIQRMGFMEGEGVIPDDFDTLGQDEIEAMFYGDDR